MLGTCSLITGAPGAGKTLGWVAWLVDDFLRRPAGRVVTNIAIHPDVIARYVHARCDTFINRHFAYAPSYDEILDRIVCLNEEDCKRLRNSTSPADFFGDIEHTYICIDEFHSYCYAGMSGSILKNWADWLAILRHHHASICAISQDVSQIDRVYKSRVEARIEFLSADNLHDPYFRIPLGDWASLISAIKGSVFRPNFRAIYTRGINGRWKLTKNAWSLIDRKYFDFYDSWQVGGALDGKV